MTTEERLEKPERELAARAKRRNRPLIVLGLMIGAIAAFITLFIADLHVYRVTSGYSGQQYWLTFSHQPTEDEFLDAIIYRDPLISKRYETAQAWRKARSENHRLYIKKDANTSILVMPFDREKDPDIVFPELLTDEQVGLKPSPIPEGFFRQDEGPNGKVRISRANAVKGIWLTEPNRRIGFPVVGVGLVYALGSFIVAAIATICTLILLRGTLILLRWFWYFLGIARLLSLGIVLLGIATAIKGWTAATTRHHRSDAATVAVCGFVIAVIGLSGLACAVLGLARLLARRKVT
ncbi:MAG: hypothetical protein K8R91_05410 [Phycisphaerae bacterium]|nr:hypothetical protein [Phycisphaerae bacterium]